MMLAWMAYAMMVGALVALAGVGAEALARTSRISVRFVWSGAMLLAVVLAVVAPLRRPVQTTGVSTALNVLPTTSGVAVKMSLLVSIETTMREVVHAIATPVATLSSLVTRYAVRGEMFLVTLWILASCAAFLTLLAVYTRFAQRKSGWPTALLFGENVRVAPNEGPAVMGIAPPEIVVPQWVLLRESVEQELVIAHEREHVRARDPLLLLAGCIVVALMPWNAALWFMWSRLRLAVELDCDARVLSHGARKPQYGQLLLELSEQRALLSPLMPAFAFGTSHLEQRIVAMTSRPARFRIARRVASCSIVAVALVAACQSELPTAQQVETMDVSAVERRMKLAAEAEYTVNGRAVSQAEASSIVSDHIASISIVRDNKRASKQFVNIKLKGDSGPSIIGDTLVMRTGHQLAVLRDDTTVRNAYRNDPRSGLRVEGHPLTNDSTPVVTVERSPTPDANATGSRVGIRGERSVALTGANAPLVFVDGVERIGGIADIQPATINTIEVIKGETAKRLYGERAVNGVITITLKH